MDVTLFTEWPATKTCPQCQATKPSAEFYTYRRGEYGKFLYSWCKQCSKGKSTEYRRNNIERVREADRARGPLKYAKSKQARPIQPRPAKKGRRTLHLNESYGISQEDYDKLRFLQGDKCAICQRSGDAIARHHRKSVKHSLYIDHDHDTGAIRGLLCARCNSMLGFAEDDPALLQKALDYLSRAIAPAT
jgi:hypothetical protein